LLELQIVMNVVVDLDEEVAEEGNDP